MIQEEKQSDSVAVGAPFETLDELEKQLAADLGELQAMLTDQSYRTAPRPFDARIQHFLNMAARLNGLQYLAFQGVYTNAQPWEGVPGTPSVPGSGWLC